ncbi:MAG TPA: CHASE domain-containing protein [Bacteriovoracaceae bacterium]|nr:CHASE domain-containing protein [Bacteriovoracaceae bacterium]
MVSVSPYLTRNAFRNYVKKLNFENEYPGIQGMGLVEKVLAKDLSTHLSQVKSEGLPSYRIWPLESLRREYFSITNLEPHNKRNGLYLGNDLSQDPVKLEAMLLARDTGFPAATGIVPLLQEKGTSEQPGIFIFVPLYRYGTNTQSTNHRHKNLVGFLFSSIRVDTFFKSVFSRIHPSSPIDFEIYQGEETRPENLVYDHDGKASFKTSNFNPSFRMKTSIDVGGKTWTIFSYSLPFFSWSFYQWIPTMVLLTGLLVTGLLFWITQIHTHSAAQEAKRARELEGALAENAVLFRQAQEALAARDEFLSIASHEFKTPLASLKLQIQSLVRYIAKGSLAQLPPEKFDKMASVFVTQLGRLTDLVDNLLDVTRARAGKLTLQREVINVVEVVSEIVERFKLQLEGSETYIEMHAPEEIVGCFDRLRIEQITENLVSNAAKYASGKPVNLTLSEVQGCLRLEIKDEGVGISEENLKRIFEKFERVSENDDSVNGLGLGLFITKQIIDAHGGVINVTSRENIGTTFTVELPMGT